VPEGDDKPLKYPKIFQTSDAFLINKTDVAPHFDFDVETFRRNVRRLNRDAPIFPVSCKTGEGLEDWIDWLRVRFSS
jgi:hydrogenase nickel incorporation protein HypB